jgi:hypothetical protein
MLECKSISNAGQKPGLVDSELYSRLKGRGFKSYTRWKWCQSHARSITVYPILVHSIIEKKKFENTGSQMGHTKKIFFLKDYQIPFLRGKIQQKIVG